MKRNAAIWIFVLAWPALVTTARAQANAQPADTAQQAVPTLNGIEDKDLQQYMELLRSNVRQRKSEVMAERMQLSADGAAKFWPIYKEYDAELNKLSDQRVANIEEYARTFTQMTNEKADDLLKKVMIYRKQRTDLLAKYYERVKDRLGAMTAVRFVQVEDQLLLLIDLQIDSSLPLVGQGS
jgi:hypothetical protein